MFNLFIQTEPLIEEADSIRLHIFGLSQSGVFAGMDFYTYSDESGNIRQGNFPITLIGASYDSEIDQIPLSIAGIPFSANSSLDFYIHNNVSGIQDYLSIYMSGYGENAGCQPYSDSLNLFFNRNTSDVLNLHIKSSGTTFYDNLICHTYGINGYDDSLTFAIPDVVGGARKTVKMYIRGQ